jgi:hypothetical protein
MASIKISDPKLFPVQAFFNAVLRDPDFQKRIQELSDGIGHGYDGDVTCAFPNELEPGEEKFDGVEFCAGNESIIISQDEFRKYLTMVTDN